MKSTPSETGLRWQQFPAKAFCETFPGSGAAGAAGHFPALLNSLNRSPRFRLHFWLLLYIFNFQMGVSKACAQSITVSRSMMLRNARRSMTKSNPAIMLYYIATLWSCYHAILLYCHCLKLVGVHQVQLIATPCLKLVGVHQVQWMFP
jgi:hypothetical protein